MADLLSSLQSFVSDLGNRSQFNKYLEDVKSFSDSTYQDFKDETTRRKKRKKASDEGMAIYVNTFLAIIDSIRSDFPAESNSTS